MNVSILYRPNSEHERAVTTFQRDYERQTGRKLELISLDTVEGADMARLYDIMRYPAVLARATDGHMLKIWQDEHLPLINEVSYYDLNPSVD